MRQPNVLDYLPRILQEIREMKAYADAVNPELSKLWENVENLFDNQYLYTMSEEGIRKWETILKIIPMGTETLEDRRFKIINRLNNQAPYTFRILESHLNQMCGENGYKMSYDPDAWTLTIKIALTSQKQYDEVFNLVNQMMPVNIVFNYGLLYNSHDVLSGNTHEELVRYNHEALRSEIIA